jgi:hypothetical protein
MIIIRMIHRKQAHASRWLPRGPRQAWERALWWNPPTYDECEPISRWILDVRPSLMWPHNRGALCLDFARSYTTNHMGGIFGHARGRAVSYGGQAGGTPRQQSTYLVPSPLKAKLQLAQHVMSEIDAMNMNTGDNGDDGSTSVTGRRRCETRFLNTNMNSIGVNPGDVVPLLGNNNTTGNNETLFVHTCLCRVPWRSTHPAVGYCIWCRQI